jgi:L-threonylcarbamoyladenylate synthase
MVLKKAEPESDVRTAEVLKRGGIVILPTDTIYGFSGLVPVSEKSIHAIKGRDEGKPFIQLIAEPSDLARFTDDPINPGLLAYWPGPITIIVKTKTGRTTAFRCPGDEWVRSVIRHCGAPVYSTSVNKAGEPALKKTGEIIGIFGDMVDLFVDDGDHPEGLPSTLVDATGSEYRIIRQGALQVDPSFLKAP